MARRGTFAFDLSQPLKRGTLLKQGAFHKAFKYRYFVLYPGFLVYYDDSQKWKLDVTKGNTLGARLGAIKLKNGTCNLARDAPRGCKFGFIVHAPDPANKRPTYLINATSKDERDEWIAAVKKATPQKSPQAPRKEIVGVAKKGSDKSKEEEKVPAHPTRTERQETANAAALLASEGSAMNGEDKVEDSITSIDEQLDLPPQTMDLRRDTAMVAALAISDEKNTSLNVCLEEEKEQTTSIDDLLGPQNDPKEDSDGETAPLQNGTSSPEPAIPNGTPNPSSDTPPSAPSPENVSSDPPSEKPQEQTTESTPEQEAETKPMDCNETVENTVNSKGKLEVITSVTIACASNGDCDSECNIKTDRGDSVSSANGGNKDDVTVTRKESNSEETVAEKEEEEQPKEEEMKSSSEVLLATNDGGTFTVNVVGDSDNTTSDEDEETPPASPVTTTTTNGTTSPPPTTTSSQEVVENGSVSPASPTPPAIMIDAPEGDGTKERTGSGSSDGSTGRLSPPQNRRKSSTPFIEKTGFLYKMGGKHKSWRRRFFILKPGGFYYYKKDPSSKPLGEVKLKNMSVFFPGVGERKQSFQFTIHTESAWNKRSDWVLAAQSEREMKEWITAFKLAGQKPGTPISGSPPSSGSDTEQ